MGSFFEVSDDPLNQRVFLQRCLEGGANTIYLETDPTIGGDISAIPFPPEMSKVDIGSVTNGSGFIINYKDKLKLTTDLSPTKSVADGADATFAIVAAGGTGPYSYQWYYNDILIDSSINPSAATATLVNHAVTAASEGVYHAVVTDSLGNTVISTKSTLTVT